MSTSMAVRIARGLVVASAAGVTALALLEFAFPSGTGTSAYASASGAVAIAAVIGGLMAGLMTVALISAAVMHEHLPPFGTFYVDGLEDLLGLVIFAANGIVVAMVGGLARHIWRHAGPALRRPAHLAMLAPGPVPLRKSSGQRRLVPFRAPGLVEPLTGREVEVLELLTAGMSNDDIAGALFLSVNTVKTHLKSIYGKLEVNSRTQAVARARALGINKVERAHDTTTPRSLQRRVS